MSEAAQKTFTIDLSAAGITRIPYRCTGANATEFTGDATKTFLKANGDPTDPRGRERLRLNKPWRWGQEVSLRVINTTAQAGKSLTLEIFGEGEYVGTGEQALQITDSGGSAIDPATSGKQDTGNTILQGIRDDTGVMEAAQKSRATLAHEQKTVGTSAVALVAASTPVQQGCVVCVKALAANGTERIYIGTSGVTTSTGFELGAGEGVTLRVTDIATLYAIGSAADLKLCWIVEADT